MSALAFLNGQCSRERPSTLCIQSECLFSFIHESYTDGEEACRHGQQVVAHFGAEQLLAFLKLQGLKICMTGPSDASVNLIIAATAESSLKSIVDGATSLAVDHRAGKAGYHTGKGQADVLEPVTLLESTLRHLANPFEMAASSEGSTNGVTANHAVLADGPACPDADRLPQTGQVYLVVTRASKSLGTNQEVGCIAQCLRYSKHKGWSRRGGSATPSKEEEAVAIYCDAVSVRQEVRSLEELDLELFGLPRLRVDVQNPPFLWPRDYVRNPKEARLIEARWWDPYHGQLNLILGRGVNASNALPVIDAETHKLDGQLASGLECVFVTVRHDFGLMPTLLAEGYRIHHAAGGGTQVVLLKLFMKVEIPTAGTHISRSKVLLYRRKHVKGQGTQEEIFLFRRRSRKLWKLPGGHVEMKELADEAAIRELKEETGYACRLMGMVALTERKDVGKKWGCSQLLFTFAAEWVESELQLDDPESREGRWFDYEELDELVRQRSEQLDALLTRVWPAFRRREGWFKSQPQIVDLGYETRKRYYMSPNAYPFDWIPPHASRGRTESLVDDSEGRRDYTEEVMWEPERRESDCAER